MNQPVLIKAVKIASSESLGIVVRCGGFHCLVSFVGSIGSLMEGLDGTGVQSHLHSHAPAHAILKACVIWCMPKIFFGVSSFTHDSFVFYTVNSSFCDCMN